MRPREHRHLVRIKARMLHNRAWTDILIRNVSSRGMLLHHPRPPSRGNYVEVRRFSQVIIARVVWSRGGDFGVRSQDIIDIEALKSRRDISPTEYNKKHGDADRRVLPREAFRTTDEKVAFSRLLGRAGQFFCLLFFGAAAAIFIADTVHAVLLRPLAEISSHL